MHFEIEVSLVKNSSSRLEWREKWSERLVLNNTLVKWQTTLGTPKANCTETSDT